MVYLQQPTIEHASEYTFLAYIIPNKERRSHYVFDKIKFFGRGNTETDRTLTMKSAVKLTKLRLDKNTYLN